MGCALRPPSLALAALLSLVVLPLSCGDSLSLQETRELGQYEIHQAPAFPGGFPAAWAAQFHLALSNAPNLQISGPHASAVVRDLLLQLEWLDPVSLAVNPALPVGLRVYFRPFMPRLAVSRGDRPIAMLADRTMAVLPAGMDEGTMRQYIRVPLDPGVKLPPAGQIPADPLLQEAFRVWPEADQIALNAGLNIVAIQRKSTYPVNAQDLAPAMSFYLDTGVEISWGRARDTVDPFAINSLNQKLTMEQKERASLRCLTSIQSLLGWAGWCSMSRKSRSLMCVVSVCR